ncbi:probable isoprenylcysteine alpha-carbonyl methylesterase ICMEL1 isoform X1 [Neltuma alba]|uniref:probable isoprenylcysteine alpha-carbonyl methylesterase ICMEL1 isoform X1 n=2 Tax=Neltuma alba TaxID=207710 RepID=UPI0010A48244|nr:probable isoprenylcysteine alpha-carbonyl methylesterase ICMEL1 isoform X1 [Prosopis alba]
MPSQILPITNRPSYSSSASAAAMLIKTADDDPSTSLLVSSRFEDDSVAAIKPLLSRSPSLSSTSSNSMGGNANIHQKRRRRSASENSLSSSSSGDSRRSSLGQDVSHVASETFLVTRLGLKLLRYLGVGYRWITRFLALGCYSMLLFPGFVQVGFYYFFSRHVRRSIVYGDKPRNRLDLYLPKNNDGPKPVVAFITGGAWIIGYKAWGSLLGQQLSERDIMVACIDYRNFPQGTMSDMIEDASQGISFVCNNIAEYGGDPNKIFLMGQSAGAHIAACALVEQAIKEAGEGESTTWSVSQIKAYFGLSGGYNLLSLVDYFHSRGLYRSIFLSIMEGEESLRQFSPELRIQEPNVANAASLLPPIVLFHGTGDYSIPSDASTSFAETLQRLGVKAEAVLYEGKTHTDLFLQDPMRGGEDDMFRDLVGYIHADDAEARARDEAAPPRRRLVPECMIQLARRVSPF